MSLCPCLEDDQLHVRKSMEKFKSDHHELEVVQYTKPGDLMALLFSFSLPECVMPIDYLMGPFTVDIIIRPHRSTTYVDAAYCFRRYSSISVGLSQ